MPLVLCAAPRNAPSNRIVILSGAKDPCIRNRRHGSQPWKADNAAQPATRLYTPLPNSVVSTDPLPGRMAIGGPRELQPAAQAPLIPGSTPGQPAGVGTAALEPGVTPQGTYAPPAPSKPRQAKKSRRPGPGTPRYNLMLSLGGVY